MIDDNTRMTTELPVRNGSGNAATQNGHVDSFTVKTGLARMLQGGVIMDVVNAEQARSYTLLSLQYPDLSTGPHCRGGRSSSGHGPGACTSGYKEGWWCCQDVGS